MYRATMRPPAHAGASPAESSSHANTTVDSQFFLFSLLSLGWNVQAKEWPTPIKALEAHGIEVVASFDAPGGVTGYAAVLQHQPIALYLTADGKHVIMGPMFDDKGVNVSEEPLDRLVSKSQQAAGRRDLAATRGE